MEMDPAVDQAMVVAGIKQRWGALWLL